MSQTRAKIRFNIFGPELIKALNNLKKAIDDLNATIYYLDGDFMRKWDKKVKFELEVIAHTAVEAFYEDYDPKSYRRTEDLFNAYKIRDDWTIDMGEEFMNHTHRVDSIDPTYVYENSFVQGFHGGAIDGPDHPEPGTPWWKIGIPGMPFMFWYKPAPQGPKPAEIIEEEADALTKRMGDQCEKEINALFYKYYNKAVQAFNVVENMIVE